jgi:hypothetical protein
MTVRFRFALAENTIRLALVCMATLAWSGGCAALSSAPVEAGPNTAPDGTRRVWVHQMIQVPTFEPATRFGADYPLVLRPTYNSQKRPQDSPATMRDAGITGVELLWGEGELALDHLADSMAELDGSGVEFAPVLAVKTVPGGLKMIRDYLGIAASHPSAAKVKVAGMPDRYVIALYGARFGKTADFWRNLSSSAGAEGLPIFLLADVVTAISSDHGTFDSGRVEPFAVASLADYAGIFDGVWTFDDGVDVQWDKMTAFFLTTHQFFTGGVMPGYNRESSENGGYSDAEATAKYRRQWEAVLASHLDWNHVVSWNDVSERHDIWPSSEWSYTRADITAFYSAKLRGAKWPAALASPQLYITTPQRINLGQAPRPVEALLLNTSGDKTSVQVSLVDGAGMAWGRGEAAPVPAFSARAATIPLSLSAIPKGRFLRARAQAFDTAGRLIQQVTSAPILVYDATEQNAGFEYSRIKYDSVAARYALPGTVRITLDASPSEGATRAHVLPPPGTTVRITEVLQNALSGGRSFEPAQSAIQIPLPPNTSSMSGGAKNTPASGFYVGRIIDSSERIGYSDPTYYPPTR